MECKICREEMENIFSSILLYRHKVEYYYCKNCGFLQTQEPHWLQESYEQPINLSDTGLLQRNIQLSKIAAMIIFFLFDRRGKFVDFAGGYGIFTRLMRDVGFDFYWYDIYTENMFAKGFEYYLSEDKKKIELVTTFESFEHFVEPIAEIEKILQISPNLLFTTKLLPDPVPEPGKWWYYGQEHGQHVSFYSFKTLEYISRKFKLNLISTGTNIFMLTRRKINPLKFKLLVKSSRFGTDIFIRKILGNKTFSDMELIKGKKDKGQNEDII